MNRRNSKQHVGSRATLMRASTSGGDRQNRFHRPVLTYEASAGNVHSLPRGRANDDTMPPLRRNWSVSPPRCAAEMPRPNVCYGAHRDVSPLGSPITSRVQQCQNYLSGHEVGRKHTPFRDDVTDETVRNSSSPKAPKRTYSRPDELHLPDPYASDVSRTDPLTSLHRRHLMNLLSRGTHTVRAAVAFERPMLRRQNAVRKNLESVVNQPLQHAQETSTIEVRLGLVKSGQQ
ncbi:hypothetical protein P171DRAFT_449316 [Karstenula rhodostoma CBS 690.94]|uniref:Uncharacterized protein n=1 Tax=Karstenula rhodostoma CBS 690.94 TaxID=1392251 RepID=A0A9P4P4A5_9PLEO|nr:hypothetical protein P171DRAFT_449316 [Karstenula rhodostoma CBS 690.94]